MATTDFVLAADIGGTHITAALIDLERRQVVMPSLVRAHVDANGSAENIIQAWTECLLTANRGQTISKICLAIPGPFDYQTGVSLMQGQGKYDSLFQQNIKDLLAGAMEVNSNTFFAENDAACFLQGEVFGGCATGDYKKVIGVTLGTGLGTAVYQNGRSRSADLWSFPFAESIAEDYLSTRWFIKRYRQLTGRTINGVKELAGKASSEPAAQAVFSEFGGNLALFLRSFVQQELPEAIVIAGNIAKAYPLFQKSLEQGLQDFADIPLKQSVLGEQSALLGAAGSWHSVAEKQLFVS